MREHHPDCAGACRDARYAYARSNTQYREGNRNTAYVGFRTTAEIWERAETLHTKRAIEYSARADGAKDEPNAYRYAVTMADRHYAARDRARGEVKLCRAHMEYIRPSALCPCQEQPDQEGSPYLTPPGDGCPICRGEEPGPEKLAIKPYAEVPR